MTFVEVTFSNAILYRNFVIYQFLKNESHLHDLLAFLYINLIRSAFPKAFLFRSEFLKHSKYAFNKITLENRRMRATKRKKTFFENLDTVFYVLIDSRRFLQHHTQRLFIITQQMSRYGNAAPTKFDHEVRPEGISYFIRFYVYFV